MIVQVTLCIYFLNQAFTWWPSLDSHEQFVFISFTKRSHDSPSYTWYLFPLPSVHMMVQVTLCIYFLYQAFIWWPLLDSHEHFVFISFTKRAHDSPSYTLYLFPLPSIHMMVQVTLCIYFLHQAFIWWPLLDSHEQFVFIPFTKRSHDSPSYTLYLFPLPSVHMMVQVRLSWTFCIYFLYQAYTPSVLLYPFSCLHIVSSYNMIQCDTLININLTLQ
jgi:hypothetical protein